jgi:hypothetical protein
LTLDEAYRPKEKKNERMIHSVAKLARAVGAAITNHTSQLTHIAQNSSVGKSS